MAVQVNQPLAHRHGLIGAIRGIDRIELGIRERGNDRRDRGFHRVEPRDELFELDAARAELERAIPFVRDLPDSKPDEMAEAAFEVERQRARGVTDSGRRLPERGRVGEGSELLDEPRQISCVQIGEFGGKHGYTVAATRP